MYSHYSRGTALPGGAVSALALKAIDYKHTHAHMDMRTHTISHKYFCQKPFRPWK